MTTFKKRAPFDAIWLMILLTALVLYFLTGCRTIKNTETASEKVIIKHDTTFINRVETIRDSTIIIQPDQMSIKALMDCDSTGKAYLKKIVELKNGKRIETRIEMRFDTLILTASIDSQAVYFQYKSIHESVYKEATQTTTEKQSEKVFKKITRLPWWVWVVLAGGVVYFIVRFYFKIKIF